MCACVRLFRYPAGQLIRNRRLAKRDTEIMVKEVWADKLKHDRLHQSKDSVRVRILLLGLCLKTFVACTCVYIGHGA